MPRFTLVSNEIIITDRLFDFHRMVQFVFLEVHFTIIVSCRQASVFFSAILKAKGIPCRSRAGFMDFGDTGDSYMEHWVNEYQDFKKNRWILAELLTEADKNMDQLE